MFKCLKNKNDHNHDDRYVLKSDFVEKDHIEKEFEARKSEFEAEAARKIAEHEKSINEKFKKLDVFSKESHEVYDLTAQRHGDFLALFETVNCTDNYDKFFIDKTIKAFNLSATKSIELIKGHAYSKGRYNTGVIVKYDPYYSEPKYKWQVKITKLELSSPDNWYWRHNSFNRARTFILNKDKEISYIDYGKPDVIMFKGIDKEIQVPYGLGEATLEIILQEIGSYWKSTMKNTVKK